MFTVEVKDSSVRAGLDELSAKLDNMKPVLQAIGEDIMERAKARFATSTGPDGQRWAPNARSTIESFVGNKGGFGKRGINKKGQGLAMNKKPLIGESKSLMKQFHVSADADSVVIGNTMPYAAMQQFGGTKAMFPNLWGDIPARPFFPVDANGFLNEHERELILAKINQYMEK